MSTSGSISEEDVLKWLLKMGCKLPDGRTITKGSLAALTKSNMQPFWEKMLYCVKPIPVAERIRAVTSRFRQAETGVTDEKGLMQIRQRRELKASLREKEARLKELRAAWQQQQTQVNFQLNEVQDTEVLQAQARQESNDHGFQAAVLTAFRQRSKALLPLVESWWLELQKVAQLARMRCEALQGPNSEPSQPGSYGIAELDEVEVQVSQAINQIRSILHSMINPQTQLDMAPAPPTSITTIPPLVVGGISAFPTSTLARLPTSPQLSPSPSTNDLVDVDLQEAARNPEIQAQVVQLATQPPALVLKVLAGMAEKEQNQVRQQIHSGDVWAFLQEAGILSDFNEAKNSPSTATFMHKKQKEHVMCFLEKEEAEAATAETQKQLEKLKTHPLWEVAMSKEVNQLVLQEARLKAEVSKLQSVILQLTGELERLQESEVAARTMYTRTQSFMRRERHLNTLMNKLIRQNVSLSSSWVERQAQAQNTVLGTLSQLEDAVNLTSKVHLAMTKEVEAAMKLPLHLLTPSAVSNPAGPGAPLVLQRQQLAVTAMSASDKSGSHSSSTTAPICPETTLAAVLRACSLLEPAAAFKCPADLISTIADRRIHLESSQGLISSALHNTPACEQQLEYSQQQVARLERDQEAWLTEVERSLVPRLEQTLALNKESMSYACDSVQTAMKDWWEQPAMHLVPWRKYMGMSCSEWLVKVQALHMELKQGRPTQ